MRGLRQALRLVVLAGCVLVAGVAGCGGTGGADQAGSPTATPPLQDSPDVSPSPSPSPSAAVPTVEALEGHLDGLIASTAVFDVVEDRWVARPAGMLSCEGSNPISGGTAVRCDWRSEDPGASSGPVFVAVLDDTGRYTFSARLGGFMAQIAMPSDFPTGTLSCATLKESPPRVERDGVFLGLDYATVLHYWMSLGSPGAMDDDRDGLPCETVYPPDVVARVTRSPLVPGAPAAGVPVTREQVRAHAEAVLTGLTMPGPLVEDEAPDWGQALVIQPTTCGGQAAATTGATLYCADWQSEYGPHQSGGVLISVLDDTGRYTYAHAPCCGMGPWLGDYPPDSTCQQLTQPPTDPSDWPHGLDYPTVVFSWMLKGRPAGWDDNGDGRPCDQAYPAEAVDGVFTSTLRP